MVGFHGSLLHLPFAACGAYAGMAESLRSGGADFRPVARSVLFGGDAAASHRDLGGSDGRHLGDA